MDAASDWSYNGDPAIGEEILRQYLTMESMHSGGPTVQYLPGVANNDLR
jgi:hypothetical protein